MITNVNKGLCHRRAQTGEASFFVNWSYNGENNYKFFYIVSSMYTLYNRLKKESNEQL